MFRVDTKKIKGLTEGPGDSGSWQSVLDRVSPDNPLNIESASILINAACSDDGAYKEITCRAGEMRTQIFGDGIKLFVPVYISNLCINDCLYCGYRASNTLMSRKTLSEGEFRREIRIVTSMGYRVIELVTSESPHLARDFALENYVRIAREEIDNLCGAGKVEHECELILMSWALDEDEFKKVSDAGLDAFYLWQETYDEDRFNKLHPEGTSKARFENRIEVFDRAVNAGIKRVGLGVLFGLAPWKFDVLALISHGKYLEKTCGQTPHAIGVPRFKHAEGAPMVETPCPVSDEELILAASIYRLAFPHTHVFLNTREKLPLIMNLIEAGGSEMNIACAVYPGGYSEPVRDRQFEFYSYPTEKTLSILKEHGYRPTHYSALINEGPSGFRVG